MYRKVCLGLFLYLVSGKYVKQWTENMHLWIKMQAKFGLIKKKRQKLSRLIIHIDSFIIFVAPFILWVE